MVRTPCCDNSGLKKGTWTPEEDRKLTAYVTRYGCWNWRQLPRFAGLARCGKSCRLRWMNYLRPNIKRGNYTKEEEDIILELHGSLGNRWSAIAAHLPGRTDNEIKNHWHTNLKKRIQKGSTKQKSVDKHKTSYVEEDPKPVIDFPVINNPETPKTTETDIIPEKSGNNDDEFAFWDAYEVPSENFWTQPFMADNYYLPSEFLPASLDLLSPLLDGEVLYSFSPCELYGGWNN